MATARTTRTANGTTTSGRTHADKQTETNHRPTRRTNASAPEVIAEHTKGVRLPLVGHLPLGRDQLAFCAGLGALAVIGVLEWPVVAAIGVGHAVVRRHHDGVLKEIGEALEDA